MSNNIFSWKRFSLLLRQHLIHNAQFLLLSTGAYVGVIFIVLSITQLGNGLEPHNANAFQAFLVGFVTVFGVLYVGHSFPAFRAKESTISYLMMPASMLEKFTFEVFSRIGLVLITLPVLYWLTFHLQGYFFTIFSEQPFEPVGFQYLVKLEIPSDYLLLMYCLITAGVLFVCSLAFTGSAMFTKQPLVKSLFAVAMVVMFFVAYSYVIITSLDLESYTPPERMYFIPQNEDIGLRLIAIALFLSTAVMLFVAYRKLKEREV